VLALVPFLYWPYRERIRQLLRRLDPGRRLALGAVSVVVLLPLVHVAVEVALIARRGPLVYGAQVDSGGGAVGKTSDFVSQMSLNTGSRVGLLLLAALAAGVAASLLRRRPDWVLCGLLAAAVAFLAFSAQTDQAASRYYIPSLTLTAIGLAFRLQDRQDVRTAGVQARGVSKEVAEGPLVPVIGGPVVKQPFAIRGKLPRRWRSPAKTQEVHEYDWTH